MQGAILLIPLTPALAVFKQKLSHTGERQCNVRKVHFVHTAPQCLVVLGPPGGHTRLQCNHFASVVGSVRVCTGMEGAASSKFGCANVNDRLKTLDTILIYVAICF